MKQAAKRFVLGLLFLALTGRVGVLLGDEDGVPGGERIYPTRSVDLMKLPGDSYTLQQIKLGKHVGYHRPPSRMKTSRREVDDTDIERLAELKNLESVKLFGDEITTGGIALLKRCQSLRYYQHLKMKNADALVSALCSVRPELVMLEVPSSDLTDNAAGAVSRLKNLQYLDLSGTKITSEFFISHPFSQKLTHLSLEGTNVDSQVIAHLPASIIYLKLYGTKVDEQAMADLLKRKGLKGLFLPSRNFSHAALKRLAEELPDAQVGRVSFSTYE